MRDTTYHYQRELAKLDFWANSRGYPPDHPATLVAYLYEERWDKSPSTVRKVVSAWRRAHRPDSPVVNLVQSAHSLRAGGRRPRPENQSRVLTASEVQAFCVWAVASNSRRGLQLRLLASVLYDTGRRWNHLVQMRIERLKRTTSGFLYDFSSAKGRIDQMRIDHTCGGEPSPRRILGGELQDWLSKIPFSAPRNGLKPGRVMFPFAYIQGQDLVLVGVDPSESFHPTSWCPACALADWLAVRGVAEGPVLETRHIGRMIGWIRDGMTQAGLNPEGVGTHSFKKAHVTHRNEAGESIMAIAADTNTSPGVLFAHYFLPTDLFHGTGQVGIPGTGRKSPPPNRGQGPCETRPSAEVQGHRAHSRTAP